MGVLLMQNKGAISRALIFSSTLFLSACNDNLEQEKSNSESVAIESSENVVAAESSQRAKGWVDRLDPNKENKKGIKTVDLADGFSVEESKQEALRVLDLSLNFEARATDKSPYLYRGRGEQLKLLPGIFESEELTSSIEMEAHFEGPHNENQEKEMTPDGAGLEFKIGF
ncbi:hypothetical protein bplSymb_SCF00705P006 [Bathymodiolus platifrons methanotrophic gill symbiont]|uniref:hypothetical protein n=2 Tax=Bathymodiolus platifrons methanotrophic gill symbiont TaxID=113268 RepID=UPI000B414AF5|nr:hypothetical protein [Bathymodiolus platifrons methanotrophic gill symbiont]TXK93309.1 hypothetical protein BMR10_16140 [Methylococcaceae bacterium CS4]TXK95526.1 hypothetical protein BMR11_13475 [Methylococcaceae bacterium CS5]TXL00445.1 hypothetical protein BMR02_05720 [Methylococcaceae bacterium HT1]TXL03891.1 hypothetical protein BMR08_16890 [Methylococcaceae bacterium CS2]TXL04335.1 hypothetical protein BMR09_12835 [Methylococcaceae bacterium CS3]TXL06251.1 hypothetical protein BMR07_